MPSNTAPEHANRPLPGWKITRQSIGEAKEPLLIIDNFAPQPDAWVKFAATQTFSKLAPYYPGVRAAISQDYLRIHLPSLLPLLSDTFGYASGARLVEVFYSIVTTPPGELVPMQRMPHFDGGGDEKLALLHYLCPQSHGGTGFYRHKSTGFQTVPDAKFDTYKAALARDVEVHGMPASEYVRTTTPVFERIGGCKAAYNRAVIYRGTNLHAIDLPEDFAFDPSPERGRLTINTFLLPA